MAKDHPGSQDVHHLELSRNLVCHESTGIPLVLNQHLRFATDLDTVPWHHRKPGPGLLCHFFLTDFNFEVLWRRIGDMRYILGLESYSLVTSPAFSTYQQWPSVVNQYNVYRTSVLAQFWQKCGINVIPILQYWDHESVLFVLQHISSNAIFLRVPRKNAKDTRDMELFLYALECVQACANFEFIYFYGSIPDTAAVRLPCHEFTPDWEKRFRKKDK